jgi:lambda repressor-like predicted transcriptional regulator
MAIFEANRTSRSLARELKVHESQVSRWRTGLHTPEPATRRIIANALGRKVEELWPDVEDHDSKAAA